MGIRASRPKNSSDKGVLAVLRKHSALMAGLMLTGMSRDEASKAAYDLIQDENFKREEKMRTK